MIAIIPALNFMQGLRGTYSDEASGATLRVWKCGYGVALDMSDGKKTQLAGVVGVHGNGIACYAQIGLPNVMRMMGDLVSTNEVRLECDDLPVVMSIVHERPRLRMTLTLSGVEKVAHLFRLDGQAEDGDR